MAGGSTGDSSLTQCKSMGAIEKIESGTAVDHSMHAIQIASCHVMCQQRMFVEICCGK